MTLPEVSKGLRVTLVKWKEIGFHSPPRYYIYSWTYYWTVLRDLDHPMNHIGKLILALDMKGTFQRWELLKDVQLGWPDAGDEYDHM